MLNILIPNKGLSNLNNSGYQNFCNGDLMSNLYVSDKDFKAVDYSKKILQIAEYEKCTFTNCVFANSDLSGRVFIDCHFVNCDLSLAKIHDTVFRDVKFNNCKLSGLHFENCNEALISFEFKGCSLDFSSFYKLNLKNISFDNCNLLEVDFTGTDLTNATLENCDLSRSIFEHSILEKTDFRTSFNYSIDPEINRIKKAKFSLSSIPGLLDKYDIEIE